MTNRSHVKNLDQVSPHQFHQGQIQASFQSTQGRSKRLPVYDNFWGNKFLVTGKIFLYPKETLPTEWFYVRIHFTKEKQTLCLT